MATQQERDLYCLRTAGYVVLSDAVDPSIISTLLQTVRQFEDELDDFQRKGGHISLCHSWPLKTSRCIYAISRECQDIVMSEAVQSVVTSYLGECILRDCLVQTNMPDSRNATRGITGSLSFHRDTKWDAEVIAPQYLHVFVFLTDSTRENGAPVVVPGTHLVREPGYYFKDSDPHLPQPGNDYRVYEQRYFPSAISLEARRGAIAFLDPMCIHSQGINVTNERRSILNMTFRARGVRGRPPLLNARRIAESCARVPVRPDLLSILEADEGLPAFFGPLRDRRD